jgi:hypothetical protein
MPEKLIAGMNSEIANIAEECGTFTARAFETLAENV